MRILSGSLRELRSSLRLVWEHPNTISNMLTRTGRDPWYTMMPLNFRLESNSIYRGMLRNISRQLNNLVLVRMIELLQDMNLL